jgi:endonuclease YncB( thermonuclease family)
MQAQAMQRKKGALRRLFSLGLAFLALAFALPASAEQAADCRAQGPLSERQVEWVSDGDTVKLDDGRFVRILGINAPEMPREDRAGHPLAEESRAFLVKALGPQPRVWLENDENAEDHYRRRLAHAFDAAGRNLSAALLEEGLAAALIMPPNERHAECYRAAQMRARSAEKGIWAEPYYQPITSRALGYGLTGFRRVEGRIVRLSRTRNSLWIELEGDRISLRIASTELPLFEEAMGKLSGDRWLGRTLIAQGYLTTQKDGAYRGRYRMRIYHPAALEW